MTNAIAREPRWPAFVAMLAAACLYLALPEPLSVGPSWSLLAIIFVLMIPMVVSSHRRRYDVARVLTFTANGVITLAMIASLAILILGITRHTQSPQALLRSATALWFTNVLVFARGKLDSSFLFPQMTGQMDLDPAWSPRFMDYLFLAFNTSTAFSPTDTAVLSRWAKAGMMVQSLISLTIVALLAARAVNIL
jgi:uncharacterized membrane protein